MTESCITVPIVICLCIAFLSLFDAKIEHLGHFVFNNVDGRCYHVNLELNLRCLALAIVRSLSHRWTRIRKELLLVVAYWHRQGLIGRILHDLRNLAIIIIRVFFYSVLGTLVVLHQNLKQLLALLLILLRLLSVSVAFLMRLKCFPAIDLLILLPLELRLVLLEASYLLLHFKEQAAQSFLIIEFIIKLHRYIGAAIK